MWKIKIMEGGGYAILYEDQYAISYRDKKVVLEKFTGENEQKWFIDNAEINATK